MNNPSFTRRRKFITGDPTQTRYLVSFALAILLPVIFVGGALCFFIFRIINEQLAGPEWVARDIFPIIMNTSLILIVVLPIVFLFLFIWGVLVSHRFVGPLERLRQEIEGLAEKGDFSKRLSVRTQDDIKPLINAFNKLLDKIFESR